MKILVFYPYIPYPVNRGTYQRTFHLLHEMAQQHEVDFFALAEKGEGKQHAGVFREFCHQVEFLDFEHPPWQKLFPGRLLNSLPSNIAHWSLPQVKPVLNRLLASKPYDLVHVCDIVLAQYFLNQPIRFSIDRSRVDLQFQLMEHKRMNFPLKQRLLRWESYAKLWFYEKKVARNTALEVVCGPDDATFIKKYIGKNTPVAVVANGANLNYFFPESAPDPRTAEPSILFCGAMDYNPNIDALRWFFGEIYEELTRKEPRLQIWIVGKAPVAEVQAYSQKPGVTVTGEVPDVRPYYRRAWVQIVPLRIGGGTRLKIVESLAIGAPVISTTIGAQGLDLRHDHEILLADTPADFVQQTLRLVQDSKLRSQLEKNGLETARNRFSWPALGRQLCQIYQERFQWK
jgi:glycosyltransferase involved in cell wall biosynthesis